MKADAGNVLEKSENSVQSFPHFLLFSEEKINVIFMTDKMKVKNDILHFLPEISMHCMLLKYKELSLFIP